MSEEGGGHAATDFAQHKHSQHTVTAQTPSTAASFADASVRTNPADLPSRENILQGKFGLNSRAQTSIDVQDYFKGPRDLDKHSKWPLWMRLHGSSLPSLLVPLIFIGGWATAIRCISEWVHSLGINTVLLTVLGFVVGLGLSFRSSTAYERYNEGRKYFSQLTLASHNLGRVIWIHGIEREGEDGTHDLLAKATALNLITAFAIALKHKLRFEPYTMYDDLDGLIGHLDTFAREATESKAPPKQPGLVKQAGSYLGISFMASNPQKEIKQSEKALGNLPLEILSYLASYIDEVIENGQLKIPMQQTLAYNNLAAMNDVLTGTDRILHTPLPVAYSIAISQITWVYVIMLPFQLESALKWVAIPATIVAAYIILSLLHIGQEIENPFGMDVNDLNLDSFCYEIAADMGVISARKKPSMRVVVANDANKVLFPLSGMGYAVWAQRSGNVIREELKFKAETVMQSKYRAHHIKVATKEVEGDTRGEKAV